MPGSFTEPLEEEAMLGIGPDELTRMFRQTVTAVNETLAHTTLPDRAVWVLSRKLHAIWREALGNVREPGSLAEAPGDPAAHPALEELMHLIDVEGRE